MIENPGNSHFWTATPVLRLQESFTGHFVSFHNCCHGGDRDKLTSLLVNFDWLDNLEATCNGQHAHKPWTPTKQGKQLRFPTSEEASYPHVLCSRIISKIASVVSDMGATITETLEEQLQDSQDSAVDRLVLSALPRWRKVKPLVAEFGSYKFCVIDPQRPSDSDAILSTLPKGAKVISRRIIRGESGRSEFLQKHSTDVLAGGLKTGPIFKRFADMCDKRTRWIHCYLQSFVHFQCSLHGHADSQIFIANLRQKKTSNFQNMHFVRVSCTFCHKIVQIVFSFLTCQIVRVGWGGVGGG